MEWGQKNTASVNVALTASVNILKCGMYETLQIYWNNTLGWTFSCKFAAYFQNTFSKEHLWMAASVSRMDWHFIVLYKLGNCRNSEWNSKSTFTWDPKWTQNGLKSQTALKCRSIYMAIYIEISLGHLSKQ